MLPQDCLIWGSKYVNLKLTLLHARYAKLCELGLCYTAMHTCSLMSVLMSDQVLGHLTIFVTEVKQVLLHC